MPTEKGYKLEMFLSILAHATVFLLQFSISVSSTGFGVFQLLCISFFLHLMLPSLQICKAFPWPQAKEIAKIFYLASEVTGKNCVQQRCLHKQGHRTVVPDKLILA